MQVNDVLVSVSHYGCTLVDFYKVKKVTNKTVVMQRLESKVVSHDGYGQAGYVVASDTETAEKPFRRVIQSRNWSGDMNPYVKVNEYRYAYPWDGKPVHFDSYD